MKTIYARQAGRSDAIWLLAGLALGAVLFFGWQALEREEAPPPKLAAGTWLAPAKALAPFGLTDHQSRPFDNRRLDGHWTYAFFGYTHCPDICPTSMAVLNRMMKAIESNGGAGRMPQVVFFSVDPERDTVERLSQFVPYFNPDFVGVTGTTEAVDTLTKQLGILHARSGPDVTGDGYLVDHSASILLFDPRGRLTAVFGAPHEGNTLALDYLRILQYEEANS